MGGNRPKNHTPARYVTVFDRRLGVIHYYSLDNSGSLITSGGQPLLQISIPFRMNYSQAETPIEQNIRNHPHHEEQVEEIDYDFTGFKFYDEYNFENSFNFEDAWGEL